MNFKERCYSKVLTAIGDTHTLDCKGFASGISTFSGTFSGVNIVHEYSNDSTNGTDGSWLVLVSASTANNSTVFTTINGITAATGYVLNYAGIRWVRVRVTAMTTGPVTSTITMTEAPTGIVVASSTSTLTGQVSHDSVISGNPFRIGARGVTSLYTAVASGDQADLICTTTGALVTVDNTIPEAKYQFTGALTTASDVVVRAAGGAGIRNYVTDIQYQNIGATATNILVKDGATTIAQYFAPANMTLPAVITFGSPIRGTAATVLNFQAGTAGANVLLNVQGFQTP